MLYFFKLNKIYYSNFYFLVVKCIIKSNYKIDSRVSRHWIGQALNTSIFVGIVTVTNTVRIAHVYWRLKLQAAHRLKRERQYG